MRPGPVAADATGLRADGISVDFEGLRAVDAVEISLAPREILGLIGPNGAGKTTIVNVLSGFQRPTAGTVVLDGSDVTARTPARRARLGLSRTFQGVRLFSTLTVRENIEAAGFGTGLGRRAARERADELLERFGLAAKAELPSGSLPYGDERWLGIARALAARPRYLLLDEPAAGLDETESDELLELLAGLPERDGCALLLIEHDMRLVMRLCHRLQVVDHGQTIAVGDPAVVRQDPAVREAYLGTGHTAGDRA